MDPDANLDEILSLVSDHYSRHGLDDDDVERLIDLIEALDGWLKNGGFLPAAWRTRERL
jgi:hypothetical protein